MRLLAPSVLVFSLLGSLLACGDDALIPRTQLTAIVDAEDSLQTEIQRLRVRVRGRAADAEEWQAPSFDQEYAKLEWPFQLAIVPEGGDPSRRALVEVIGVNAGGQELITLRAITGFLEQRTLALPLLFEPLCLKVSCTEVEKTCRKGSCQSALVDQRTLVDLDAYNGRPNKPGRDGGPIPAEDGGSEIEDGGPSEAPEAGEDPTDDGSMPPEDAGTDASSEPVLCGTPEEDATVGEDCPQVVFCGLRGPCDTSQNLCCLDSVAIDDKCEPLESCGSHWPVECDGPTDCAGGQVCCWEGFGTRCKAKTACEAGSVLCHDTSDCPPGGTCKPGLNDKGITLYSFWGVCRKPMP